MIMNFALPFMTQALVDEGYSEKSVSSIIEYAIFILIIAVIISMANLLMEKNRLSTYTYVRETLEKNALSHLMKIDMSYFVDQNATGTYHMLHEDVDVISGMLDRETFEICSGLLCAVSGAVALSMIDWRLVLIVILFIPVHFISYDLFAPKVFKKVKDLNEQLKSYSDHFGELADGMEEIRLGSIKDSAYTKFAAELSRTMQLNRQKGWILYCHLEVQEILYKVFTFLLYLFVGLRIVKGGLSLGSAVAFETYALMMLDPVISGINILMDITSITPSVDRYNAFMNFSEENNHGTLSVDADTQLELEAHDISFKYGKQKQPLFNNICFHFHRGEKIALIGHNGSGKTTIVKLILRTIAPDTGTLTLNGTNVEDIDISAYRKLFSVVTQNFYLFNSTIRDNICLYNRTISDEELDSIVQKANLVSLIREKGFSFMVGENGCNLSGGQRQKIALARALASDNPMVILDEFTSNLDQETILSVREILKEDFKNKVILCITHDQRYMDCFDRIYYLDGKGNLKSDESCYNR